MPPTIVGFFGLIREWVDLEVIAALAQRFPDAPFVLIGRSEIWLDPIEGHPNVHWLGPVLYADLPGYAQRFRRGIYPIFVRNELTKAVNPLKLMEYLCFGLPIHSTRLPELEDIDGPVWRAQTLDEFCLGLNEILQGDLKKYETEAIEVARQNTWDGPTRGFEDFIEQTEVGRRYPTVGAASGSASPKNRS